MCYVVLVDEAHQLLYKVFMRKCCIMVRLYSAVFIGLVLSQSWCLLERLIITCSIELMFDGVMLRQRCVSCLDCACVNGS